MKNYFESLNLFFSQLNTKTEQKVARILFNNSMILSVAESCTGGLLSSRLTDISGSSAYIKENYITYSNESKINLLEVNPETIEKYGAVSEECAREMVDGLYKKTGADVCLVTTGIAGPTSSEEGKEIGLMYLGIKNKYRTIIEKVLVDNKQSRKTIKYAFTQKALQVLTIFLQENLKQQQFQLKFQDVFQE